MKTPQILLRFPWLLPTLIFTILVILGANMHPLWGDEAETALFARNILKYGVPKGWDGVNIMGINNAVVLNQDLINHTSPWAQYYLTAVSFALFGQSSFTARLPLIFLSILSLPLMYWLALKFTKSNRTATFTVVILAVSVPFILFSYQARYYALTSFASICLLLALLYRRERKPWATICFILSGILLFYANYVVFVAFYLSLFLSYVPYLVLQKSWQEMKRFVLWFVGTSVLIGLFTMPWYLYFKPSESRGGFLAPSLSFQYISDFLQLYYGGLYHYNLNNAFPVLFVPLFIFACVYRVRRKQSIAGFIFIILIPLLYIFFMAAFTAIVIVDTSFVDVRYTMNSFPFFTIAVAMLFTILWQWKKPVALVVLTIYLLTNLFTLYPTRSFLFEFAQEVISPYPTPDKVVANYLHVQAKEDDTAFVSLDRDHEPLIFHLKDKIRFVNRVSLINTRIFPKNRGIIPRYIYDFRDEPDWVIFFSKRENDGSFALFDQRELPPEINLADHYEEIVLPVHFSDMSRPEIDLRTFHRITPEPLDQVFVYRKRNR